MPAPGAGAQLRIGMRFAATPKTLHGRRQMGFTGRVVSEAPRVPAWPLSTVHVVDIPSAVVGNVRFWPSPAIVFVTMLVRARKT